MMPVGASLLGFIAEATSAQTAVLCGGLGLGLATIAALIVRPQIATLAVTRDGESMTGDLRGSGRRGRRTGPIGGLIVQIVVVTPHTDDFIYGLGGTLLTHADDDIHIVAVCSVQQAAARDVAAGLRRDDRVPRRARITGSPTMPSG